MQSKIVGGLKSKNLFNKVSYTGKPLISVITVVYNSEKLIENTIKSIINQTYENIEYIVIDGGSKDKTVDIIKQYDDKIAYWLSEKDNGIYDAMNKAIDNAIGKYLIFINSGDMFYSNNTVENIFKNSVLDADIYYGETVMIDNNNEIVGMRRLKTPENLTFNSFKSGMVVCHQSIFIKKEIAGKYNLNYKYTADFEWVLQSLKNSKSIINTHEIISRYLTEGTSRNTIKKSLKERFIIMKKHYGLYSTIINHFAISFKFFKFLFKNKRF